MTDSVDFLIVGGGIAGLRAAIALAPRGPRRSSSPRRNPPRATPATRRAASPPPSATTTRPRCTRPTRIRAGDGLCDEAAVDVLVEEGPRYVRELLEWGARFDRDADGRLALGREAAHSVRRVLHAGDATGREIGRVLWERVQRAAVRRDDRSRAASRDCSSNGRRGARRASYFDADGDRRTVRADATLLATGGAGQVFRETTNPAVATGDGIALAYHAGARVADLEFVQFHPTALNVPARRDSSFPRRCAAKGARLVNADGEPFMTALSIPAATSRRATSWRAASCARSERTGGPVFLTLAHLDADYVRARFPTIAAMCARSASTWRAIAFPVGPAAHYIMGGVDTDEWARTSRRRAVCRRRSRLHRRARRESAGEQLAARGAGLRRARGDGDDGAAARRAVKSDRVSARRVARWRRSRTVARVQVTSLRRRARRAAGARSLCKQIRDLMWREAGLFRTRQRLGDAVAHSTALASASAADGGGMAAPESAHRRAD